MRLVNPICNFLRSHQFSSYKQKRPLSIKVSQFLFQLFLSVSMVLNIKLEIYRPESKTGQSYYGPKATTYCNEENRTNRVVSLLLARNSFDPLQTLYGTVEIFHARKSNKNEVNSCLIHRISPKIFSKENEYQTIYRKNYKIVSISFGFYFRRLFRQIQ